MLRQHISGNGGVLSIVGMLVLLLGWGAMAASETLCSRANTLRENAQKLRRAAADCRTLIGNGTLSSCQVEVTFRNNELISIGAAETLADDLTKEAQKLSATITARYPTGPKAFHLTAKSWIDRRAIREFTVSGVKLRLFPNDEPTGPLPNAPNDFKIYQTFVAEVSFADCKISSARFLPHSLDARAGKTAGFQGEIRVIHERQDISPDRDRVTFIRTVEGNPNKIIMYGDPLVPLLPLPIPLKGMVFKPIFNTLRLEVTAEGNREVSWDGSAFPSHKFWIGDTLFHSQEQVQPSNFFK